ncbi:MAG: nucleotide exchange factor GrpE [Verrucomicrobiota bacterium]
MNKNVEEVPQENIEEQEAEPIADPSPLDEKQQPEEEASSNNESEDEKLPPEELVIQLNEQMLRMRADFDNFRRRLQKEKEDSIKFANEGLIESLIPIFDNFELGLLAAEQGGDAKSLLMGMNMVKEQLKRFLSDYGLEAIEAHSGEFDPHLHEAVAHESSEEVAEGHIIEQRRKGFKLKDRLVRPATVVVAKS